MGFVRSILGYEDYEPRYKEINQEAFDYWKKDMREQMLQEYKTQSEERIQAAEQDIAQSRGLQVDALGKIRDAQTGSEVDPMGRSPTQALSDPNSRINIQSRIDPISAAATQSTAGVNVDPIDSGRSYVQEQAQFQADQAVGNIAGLASRLPVGANSAGMARELAMQQGQTAADIAGQANRDRILEERQRAQLIMAQQNRNVDRGLAQEQGNIERAMALDNMNINRALAQEQGNLMRGYGQEVGNIERGMNQEAQNLARGMAQEEAGIGRAVGQEQADLNRGLARDQAAISAAQALTGMDINRLNQGLTQQQLANQGLTNLSGAVSGLRSEGERAALYQHTQLEAQRRQAIDQKNEQIGNIVRGVGGAISPFLPTAGGGIENEFDRMDPGTANRVDRSLQAQWNAGYANQSVPPRRRTP